MANFFSNTHKKYPTPQHSDKPTIEYQGQIPSVSFSTLSNFEQCPYRVYLSKVHNGGCAAIGSKAMDRGSQIHQMLEQYVRGEINKVTWSAMKSGKYYASLIEEFKNAYTTGNCHPELDLAFTKNMKQCEWTANEVWLRGAIDVALFSNDGTHVDIYDYKTGSDYSTVKHRSQLMLYACMMFIVYPKLITLRSSPIYLDHSKKLFRTDYHRNDLEIFWGRFNERLQKVTDATEFPPNPNAFTCKWCQHREPQPTLDQTEPLCIWGHTTQGI